MKIRAKSRAWSSFSLGSKAQAQLLWWYLLIALIKGTRVSYWIALEGLSQSSTSHNETNLKLIVTSVLRTRRLFSLSSLKAWITCCYKELKALKIRLVPAPTKSNWNKIEESEVFPTNRFPLKIPALQILPPVRIFEFSSGWLIRKKWWKN